MDGTEIPTESQTSTDSSFLKDISRYFRDFLDTDFKRQRLPKRQVSRKDRDNNLTGSLLNKYPVLAREIWTKLAEPYKNNLEIKVSRGRYTAPLAPELDDLIQKHVEAIEEQTITDLHSQCRMVVRETVKAYSDDPVILKEKVVANLQNSVIKNIVVPLLQRLEKYFEKQNIKSIETIYDIEEELADILVGSSDEAISHALNSAMVSGEFDEYDTVLKELLNPDSVRFRILQYFSDFTSSDVYSDLLELRKTLKVKENTEIYLYLCDLHYDKHSYPLFYLPLEVRLEESVFTLSAKPHLYINKRAIDFVIQEVARANKTTAPSVVKDRIIYLNNGDVFTKIMQGLLDEWDSALMLRPPINLALSQPQSASSTLVKMTNSAHLSAFERSDEALINDYEALLDMADGDNPIFKDFQQLIMGFLKTEPVSVNKAMDTQWFDLDLEDRLVCRSPLPMNEEQRKIANAIYDKQCRLIAVSGPPGTGKSHSIVALTFDAILKKKNVLVLSDKIEALDVVEDKLTATLNSVRLEDDFQNPILRFGRSNNTYQKILSNTSIERLRRHHRIAESQKDELDQELKGIEGRLKLNLKAMAEHSEKIDLGEVIALNTFEQEVEKFSPEAPEHLTNDNIRNAILDIQMLSCILSANNFRALNLLSVTYGLPTLLGLKLLTQLNVQWAHVSKIIGNTNTSLTFFSAFEEPMVKILENFILEYEDLRLPVFGFLFHGNAVREINKRLGDEIPCKSTIGAHKQLDTLKTAHQTLANLQDFLSKTFNTNHAPLFPLAFQQHIQQINFKDLDLKEITARINHTEYAFTQFSEMEDIFGLTDFNLEQWCNQDQSVESEQLQKIFEYCAKYEKQRYQFVSLPQIDYTGEKTQLESLHTRTLANTIDERVVDFFDNHRSMAKSLKDIIRSKQKFPREKFEDLKNAFPVMICNIRDYAEYVPLDLGLFDLVIIDEASQVSIAQAFPAIIRAKKLVVLGDLRQFSNVKTSNASIKINNQYTADIRENFINNENPDTDVLNRLSKFNIKTSILEFVEMMANYSAMLRKHFRGYPELISFSSKYFYNNDLQAVKIRGKKIEDVLAFDFIETDGKMSVRGNANELEGDFIESQMLELLKSDEPPSVAVITPFNDQQRYLTRRFSDHHQGPDFFDKLHLKVMTFDSCQGEERDTVFYSMVASPEVDKLYTIFPKAIEGAGDVEDTLRLQRLNVGFSRAKEKIHFVLSQPLEEFRGAIGTAIRHYARTLENAKALPGQDEVDPNSPMEGKVLHWLQQTAFFQTHAENMEIIPQFPIGDYLRQLDHTYKHPAYRIDFLIRLQDNNHAHNIVIEYDGFKEHFTNLEHVDASNYRQYQKAEDIEREKILEGYGYHFIRLNRFNLGTEPVDAISDMLTNLLKRIGSPNQPHQLVADLNASVKKLESGELKACPKCGKVKELEFFKDEKLKSGVGRVCRLCKGKMTSMPRKKHTQPDQSAAKHEICPSCGGPMRVQVARKGSRKGNKFLGCARFPICKGTRELI